MLWTFSPFVMARKRFYTAVIWARLLMVLVGEPASNTCLRAIHARVQPLAFSSTTPNVAMTGLITAAFW